MNRTTLAWMALAGIAIGTYLIRASFLAFADRVAAIPDHWRTPLALIPPAVLGALVAPAVLRPEGVLTVVGPRPVAALLALGVALWTRSVVATIVVGLAAVTGLEALWP